MGPTAFSRKYTPTNVQGFHHAGAPAHNPNPITRNRMANSHVIVLSISLAIVFSLLAPVRGFLVSASVWRYKNSRRAVSAIVQIMR